MKAHPLITVVGMALFVALVALSIIKEISPVYPLAELLVLLLLLAVGSFCIRLNFFTRSINQFTPQNRQIALTFDDGPDENTKAILDVLKKENAHATFFLIGRKIENSNDTVQRIEADGHTIGCHSFYHKNNFPLQSAGKMSEEIDDTNTLVFRITGKTPIYFRPPFGVTNPNVIKALKRTGMQSVGWSLRSFDTQTKDSEKLLKKFKKRTRNGQIVLLHDTQKVTVLVLKKYIGFLKKQGFQMVSLQQVFNK